MLLPQHKGRWYMAKSTQKKFNVGLTIFLSALFLIVGAFGGLVAAFLYDKNKNPIFESDVVYGDGISFHFLELGNKYSGDCTFIQAGETDILIDAGSAVSSIPTIQSYLNEHMQDNVLEYVIVTHAHEDHYAGFIGNASTDSLFELFEVETIIEFAKTGQTGKTMYNNYVAERNAEIAAGAKCYTALDCVNQTNGAKTEYEISKNVTFKILNQKFYTEEAETENDYSVCTLFSDGNNNFLFTGDLEEEGEESLVELNDLPHCALYKAGHHGSKTSSHNVLLNKITPEIVCVCCCAGNYEYTVNSGSAENANLNNFPTQDFINRIAPHTDKVYVTTLGIPSYNPELTTPVKYRNDGFTSMNGNIVVKSSRGEITVECSNNNTLLKDTDWFKENRTTPTAWATAAA